MTTDTNRQEFSYTLERLEELLDECDADIDYDTIGESIKKTGTLVIIEQATACHSIGPTIAHECQSRFFDYLDGPIEILTGKDVPNPVSKILESTAVPSVESVGQMLKKVARRNV